MLPADPTSTADTSHVILPVAASTYTSPPHGDPDPGTPAPKWPGPRDPSAKLARTPDPGPRPGPRTTRAYVTTPMIKGGYCKAPILRD